MLWSQRIQPSPRAYLVAAGAMVGVIVLVGAIYSFFPTGALVAVVWTPADDGNGEDWAHETQSRCTCSNINTTGTTSLSSASGYSCHSWHLSSLHSSPSTIVSQASQEQRFIMVVQTYRRDNMLRTVLAHYCKLPSLDHVVVVWNNIDREPPNPTDFVPSCPVPICFVRQRVNSLNNRFLPQNLFHSLFQRYGGDSQSAPQAVFMIDDDLIFRTSDVEDAFRVWKDRPLQLVGFVPRLLHHNERGEYAYDHCDKVHGNHTVTFACNLILTGAAFFYRIYMCEYQQYAAISRYVDEIFNCEDIGMNFVVHNVNHDAVVYVSGYYASLSQTWEGISGSSSHLSTRATCGAHFNKMLRRDPPVSHFVLWPDTVKKTRPLLEEEAKEAGVVGLNSHIGVGGF